MANRIPTRIAPSVQNLMSYQGCNRGGRYQDTPHLVHGGRVACWGDYVERNLVEV